MPDSSSTVSLLPVVFAAASSSFPILASPLPSMLEQPSMLEAMLKQHSVLKAMLDEPSMMEQRRLLAA